MESFIIGFFIVLIITILGINSYRIDKYNEKISKSFKSKYEERSFLNPVNKILILLIIILTITLIILG